MGATRIAVADAERAAQDATDHAAALYRRAAAARTSATALRRLKAILEEDLTDDEAAQALPLIEQILTRIRQISDGATVTAEDLLLPLRVRPDQTWPLSHVCAIYGIDTGDSARFIGPLVRSGHIIRVGDGVYRMGAPLAGMPVDTPPLRVRLLQLLRHGQGDGLTISEIHTLIPRCVPRHAQSDGARYV